MQGDRDWRSFKLWMTRRIFCVQFCVRVREAGRKKRPSFLGSPTPRSLPSFLPLIPLDLISLYDKTHTGCETKDDDAHPCRRIFLRHNEPDRRLFLRPQEKDRFAYSVLTDEGDWTSFFRMRTTHEPEMYAQQHRTHKTLFWTMGKWPCLRRVYVWGLSAHLRKKKLCSCKSKKHHLFNCILFLLRKESGSKMDLKYTYGEKRNKLNVANWPGKRKRNVIASSATDCRISLDFSPWLYGRE